MSHSIITYNIIYIILFSSITLSNSRVPPSTTNIIIMNNTSSTCHIKIIICTSLGHPIFSKNRKNYYSKKPHIAYNVVEFKSNSTL